MTAPSAWGGASGDAFTCGAIRPPQGSHSDPPSLAYDKTRRSGNPSMSRYGRLQFRLLERESRLHSSRTGRIGLEAKTLRAAAGAWRNDRSRYEGKRSKSDMKARQGLTGIGLLALVAAGAVGMYLTSRPLSSAAANGGTSPAPNKSLSLDSRYLQTALQLAAQADTPGERSAAANALSAAGRELDLQYAYALQLAAIASPPATPRIHALQERVGNIAKRWARRMSAGKRSRTEPPAPTCTA